MEKKSLLLTLDNEFIQYCKLNNIIDIEKFAKDVFQKGFTLVKYGEIPRNFLKPSEKIKENITPTQPIIKSEPEINIKKNDPLYDE